MQIDNLQKERMYGTPSQQLYLKRQLLFPKRWSLRPNIETTLQVLITRAYLPLLV